MKKIACFFTCGRTEMDDMRGFLQRIHPGAEYTQFCPTRTRRRKHGQDSSSKDLIMDNLNGLTGESLLKFVYQFLRGNHTLLSQFDAVLIEDDLDEKFSEETIPGIPTSRERVRGKEFEKYCSDITDEIRRILNRPELPVILLFASPEIETWFLSDWNHSFGIAYGPEGNHVLNRGENDYFSSAFQNRVGENVLRQYQTHTEDYGFFQGKYSKLSEDIIHELRDFRKTAQKNTASTGRVWYSKNAEGSWMLAKLDPDTVYQNCPVYFRAAVDNLREL